MGAEGERFGEEGVYEEAAGAHMPCYSLFLYSWWCGVVASPSSSSETEKGGVGICNLIRTTLHDGSDL